MRSRIAINVALALALTACATPDVMRSGSAFDETLYTVDLDDCRGGGALTASAKTVGTAMLGSMYGLLEGAVYGADRARTLEEAAVGAAIGGTIGLAAGAIQAVKNREDAIAGCMADKGYLVVG